MANLSINLDNLEKIAIGIQRPEDIVVFNDGRIYASDHNCAVAQINPDGSFTRLGSKTGASNGINATKDGKIIIANFGIYDGAPGPLEAFEPISETREVLACEIEGRKLTSSNYPIVDEFGNIFCANSTHAPVWMNALDGRGDGFVYVKLADGNTKILAEKLCFPNGLALSADGKYLYCCQTSACNIMRFEIEYNDGVPNLKNRRQYGPKLGIRLPNFLVTKKLPNRKLTKKFGFIMQFVGYPDGCGMDIEGNLWVTMPGANKIVAITPNEELVTIVHDIRGEILDAPTNVCWGGADLKDLYIGSLEAQYVLKTRSPIAGLKLAHQK